MLPLPLPLAWLLALGAVGLFVILLVWPLPRSLAAPLRPGALVLSGCWALWRLWWLERTRAQRRAWHQSPRWTLTPSALRRRSTTGLYLGAAFRWTGRHTQVLETALATTGALPVATDSRGGHPALHAVGAAQEQPLTLPWGLLARQTGITGTNGSGKTRLLEALTTGAIASPGPTIVIDPKGDRDWLLRCAVEAQRQGKPFALLTPAFPTCSATLNPLATATTVEEVMMRIHALMPSAGGRTGEPFFEQYSLAFLRHVAAAQQALGEPWTLAGLAAPATEHHALHALLERYLLHLGCDRTFGQRGAPYERCIAHYRAQHLQDATANALIEDVEKSREYFTKVTGTLMPTFSGITDPPLRDLFSPAAPTLAWPQIVQEEQVVYIALASLLYGELSNRMGRMLLQDLMGFLGRRYAYEACNTVTPITVFVDELRQVLFPGFPNALAQARGAQGRFVVAEQSLADAEAGLHDRALARVLHDNLNTRIWLRVADDQSAADATEGLGECLVELPENGTQLSYGGVGGLSGSASRRLRQEKTALFRPEWLKALPTGEGLVRLQGEVWKLRIPRLEPLDDALVDQVGLRPIWEGLAPHPDTTAKEPV